MKHKFQSINSFANMYRHKADIGMPTVDYHIKTKLHGTNASILMTPDGGFECRSKNRVLSFESDHMNFTKTMEVFREDWNDWYDNILGNEVLIMGEWAGPGVQKTDAVSMIPEKVFFVFAVMVDGEVWTEDVGVSDAFKDTNRIEYLQPLMTLKIPFDITQPIEETVSLINCTVAKYEEQDPYIWEKYGVEGCGEGVVGVPAGPLPVETYFGYAFKAKTEAHRVKKTKAPATAREPLPQEALQFASMYVTEPRMDQAMSELGIDNPSMQNTKDIINWMNTDIIKESVDDLRDMGMDYSKVAKCVNTKIVGLWKARVLGLSDG